MRGIYALLREFGRALRLEARGDPRSRRACPLGRRPGEAETVLAPCRIRPRSPPLQRRLAAVRPDAAIGDGRWTASSLIGQIARYGAAARASGPAITPYLGASQDEDLRANAALALGRIDARAAVPALRALAPALSDDWLLAYNVAESLGRLRAEAARPLLEGLAREHWHRGVRRNAARALGALSGGPSPCPPARSGAPIPIRAAPWRGILYVGGLRSPSRCHPRLPAACALPGLWPAPRPGTRSAAAFPRRLPAAR